MVRDAGRCRRCNGIGEQIQHRRSRGRGGTSNPHINDLPNLVLLCVKCHDDVENRERLVAFKTGWAVKHGVEEPSMIPLKRLDGSEFFLTDEGTVVEL